MLTAADKKWLRSAMRRILVEEITKLGGELSDVLDKFPHVAQMGGYDGAIPVVEDYAEEGRARPVIGFHAPT